MNPVFARVISFLDKRPALLFRVKATTAFLIALASPLRAATGSPSSPAEIKPEIEFRVLLIIKKRTEAWSPLFLPVRADMTAEEIATARRCFEIETPDMVRDITRGRVRFVPTVKISEEPLRWWNPDRRDSAEVSGPEMLAEFRKLAKPGQYDSVGYYFLPRDPNTGYSIPRAGYGVGWFDQSHSLGMFAIHANRMNPRDEIFLHEWMHGLEQFYNGKPNVRLPKGWLHGIGNYPQYKERVYRPGDTFRGWMDYYKDFLNREIKESDGVSGLGTEAWAHGPMREKQPKRFPEPDAPKSKTRQKSEYPAWLTPLLQGNPKGAKLGPNLLTESPTTLSPWQLKTWSRAKDNQITRDPSNSTFHFLASKSDNLELLRKIPLQPQRNYLFSAEVKTQDVAITEPNGKFSITLSAAGSRSPKVITGTQDWTPISVSFTTGDKKSEPELKLALGGFGSVARGQAWFRQVKLQEILYPEPTLSATPDRR